MNATLSGGAAAFGTMAKSRLRTFLEWWELRRSAARIVYETVLIVDPRMYWWAELPVAVLLGQDPRARYVNSSRWAQWLGLGLGVPAGVMIFGLLGLVALVLSGSVVLSGGFVLWGAATGAAVGFRVGRRWAPGPIWVFRRKKGEEESPGQLDPVYPRDLIDDYLPGKDTPHVIRSDSFERTLRQEHTIAHYKQKDPRREKMQLIGLAVVLVALIVIGFLMMAMMAPREILPPAVGTGGL